MKPAFSLPVRVWFKDLDAFGHVNNATYLTYMETARVQHLMRLYRAKSLNELDVIVARVEVNYRSPATFGETLVVSLLPGKLGRKSWTYRYEIREKLSRRLVVDAESVQVAYDRAAGKATPIPEKVKRKLEKLVGRT